MPTYESTLRHNPEQQYSHFKMYLKTELWTRDSIDISSEIIQIFWRGSIILFIHHSLPIVHALYIIILFQISVW
jgi:hypothetical protein